MRVGVISDIHSNLPALEAVLEDMPAVDAMVCAGDVVGYNPWPAACVDAVRDRGIPTIMGNHDRKVARETNFGANAMARAGVEHARRTLDDEHLEWLQGLPTERREFDGRMKIVHGHPEDPDRYTYPEEFSRYLLGDEQVLVMGHTHVQHAERFGEGLILNPGSVGQPRDHDSRAAYAVVDLDGLTADTYRVEYDIDRVVAAVEETGLPRRTGERLRKGR